MSPGVSLNKCPADRSLLGAQSVLADRAADPSSHICHFPVKAEFCHADPASVALGCVSHSRQLPPSWVSWGRSPCENRPSGVARTVAVVFKH